MKGIIKIYSAKIFLKYFLGVKITHAENSL